VVVTGTGTEVGKTWVASHLLGVLGAAGRSVAARKPVQSFAPGDARTDADVLAAATGEDPLVVCPGERRYERAMAPPMAAAALGRATYGIADLAAEITWPPDTDVGLVEGAGGLRSPLASDGDTVDFAALLAPDLVVLVADAGLGTINAVRLSVSSIAAVGAIASTAAVCVFLNRYDERDELHVANRDWLTTRDGLDVVVTIDELAARLPPVPEMRP